MLARMRSSTSTGLTGLAALAVALLGCAPTVDDSARPDEAADPAASSRPSEAGEASVRPGVNDKYYADDAVETWTDKLERERREVIANREAIVAALEVEPGMVVADVGAGTGAFLEDLSEAVGDEGELYAVDIAPPFLEHLRARAEASGLTNVAVVEATDRSVGLPADSVDLLFLCDVYHHLEYPATYLRSLHDALRPDGRLVIVEFEKIPGKTSERMMKHVRQDKATLLAEVTAEGFALTREIESVPLEENYMLEFSRGPR